MKKVEVRSKKKDRMVYPVDLRVPVVKILIFLRRSNQERLR
jgi:hypothetical protein